MRRREQDHESDGLDTLATLMAAATGLLIFLLVAASVGMAGALAPLAQVAAAAQANGSNEAAAAAARDLADAQAEQSEATRVPESEPPAAEEIDEARELLASLAEAAAAAETTLESHRVEAENQLRALRELEAELARLEQSLGEVDLLEVDAMLARRTELEAELARLHDELANQRVATDSAKAAVDTKQKVVRLPRPRSAPEELQPLAYACRHGRIVPFTSDASLQTALSSGIAAAGSKSVGTVSRHFSSNNLGNEHFRLRISTRGMLTVRWRNDRVGETTEQAGHSGSAFLTSLAETTPERHFVTLYVWSDSFETYLAARDVVSARGFGVAWIPYGPTEEYTVNLLDNTPGDRAVVEY